MVAACGGFRARASKGSGQEERSELGPMRRKGTRTLEAFGRGSTRGYRAHVPDPGSDDALAAPHAGTSGCCGGGGYSSRRVSVGQGEEARMTSGHDTGRRVSEPILCPKFEEPRTMACKVGARTGTNQKVCCHRGYTLTHTRLNWLLGVEE